MAKAPSGRAECAPPQHAAILPHSWRPDRHTQAPEYDSDQDDEDWVAPRVDAMELAEPEVAAPADALASNPTPAPAAQELDSALLAQAERRVQAQGRLPLVGKEIDHVVVNEMLRAKLRAARLGPRLSGESEYHLSVVVVFALRQAPSTPKPLGRSRDYRKMLPQEVTDGKETKEIPPWTWVRYEMDSLLDALLEKIAPLPPYDRAAAIAEQVQALADRCLPNADAIARAAMGGGAAAASAVRRRTRYQYMQLTVDKWMQAVAHTQRLHVSIRDATIRHEAEARAKGAVAPIRLTAEAAHFMASPPAIFSRLFGEGKRAKQAARVTQLWHQPGRDAQPPIVFAEQVLAACRQMRAYHEMVLDKETARLAAVTKGMELRLALRTVQNFAAAAWSIYNATRKGTARGPDAPLAFVRTASDSLVGNGPAYAPEIIKQVGEKWAWKHVSGPALEYALRVTGFAARALPKPANPDAWETEEYTLTNLKSQLRKIRANLAQGQEGPHLYPLAQMGDRVLEAFLAALQEAVGRGERHSSFGPWRLLFILKKGRDRYDLKGGCRLAQTDIFTEYALYFEAYILIESTLFCKIF